VLCGVSPKTAGHAAVGLLWGVALIAGCGSSDTADRKGPPIKIDERKGRVGSAALGDSPAEVAKVFGKPEGGNAGGALPVGADFDKVGAPGTYAFPKPCDRDHGGPDDGTPRELGVTELRYRGVGVSYCDNHAFLFIVSSGGSRTRAGASVGQPLAAARRAHPALKCGKSPGSTRPPEPVFEYCAGRAGSRRYLWLGRDPVGSIVMATVPLKP
jgi:hypothetical protein